MGVADVTVTYASQVVPLPLVIVKGQGSTLFGRNWLTHIQLDWSCIKSIHSNSSVFELISKYSHLFSTDLGTLKGVEAKIFVAPNAQPRFYKPRPVPYALKDRVEKELERLQADGIITPVQFSDWAAPIVPVIKYAAITVSRSIEFLRWIVTLSLESKICLQPCQEAVFTPN